MKLMTKHTYFIVKKIGSNNVKLAIERCFRFFLSR